MSLSTVEAWFDGSLSWLSGWMREAVITAVLVGLALAAVPAVRWWWHRVMLPIARRTPTTLDVTLLSATERYAARAAAFLVLYAAVNRLAGLPALEGTTGGRILDGVFYALMVLAVTRLLVAATDGLARWYLTEMAHRTSTQLDEHFVPVVTRVAAVTAYFIAATVVLARFNINVTALVTTAGVASLALALAAQETLANMFAGFTIMLDRSYRVGDRIRLSDGTMGDVVEIGLRATKILNFDNELVIIPNKEMAAARIVNQNYPDLRVKVRPKVGVSYATDVERAKQVMLEVCMSHPKVLKDPPPGVYFTDFGPSSLNLLGLCWVGDYRDAFQVLDELNVAIKKRFDREGIEIPFPQHDVHLRAPLRLEGREPARGSGPAAPG
ncbi:mechanosensitive ion channel domain-containing protein [Carboxydochorda subterranea]|uniref:Mechanosensitive ion channel domain-containing protein n=1 Tax=Carboxydichorda subterranea TaxID=3109565 RepID=A0ABZ1BWA4_9FIRM|nr:mechanosensitive ion channel domain-containing protein [Limnochorda sp. L945t]WRP16863.1 mechanosensitive ion channel domain-containing protein [Limnochorda sp. L945t]